MGSSPALWRSVISPNLKHQRILQSVHRSQFAMTLVPRGLLALDRTVHPAIASGFRLGGSSEHDDAGYDDPPDDEDGSRCRRTPPDGAVKLSRVVTEEHGWNKCEVD
jgi:hypothetical protein